MSDFRDATTRLLNERLSNLNALDAQLADFEQRELSQHVLNRLKEFRVAVTVAINGVRAALHSDDARP